ncbi:hypothetical protein OPT61_g9320 [Boeremia exigua]|uniref:Uncharacterized protein n=1 Tax=Boeremia exigua TaxID=749465 RepID=A0ACC2HUL1_9PLEO|nr:hypothetical protein OPT61_g9320 [Boeremia exigua]
MASDKSDVQKQEGKAPNALPAVTQARANMLDSADQVCGHGMSEEMQNEAIEVAQQAMEQFTIEKDIAQYIKKEASSRARNM